MRRQIRRPYYVLLGDRGGEFGTWHAETFAGMCRLYTILADRYPTKVFCFGNEDREDVDDNGLTEDEQERIDELVERPMTPAKLLDYVNETVVRAMTGVAGVLVSGVAIW